MLWVYCLCKIRVHFKKNALSSSMSLLLILQILLENYPSPRLLLIHSAGHQSCSNPASTFFQISSPAVFSCFSHVRLFITLQSIDRQASLSMGLCRQEYWGGLPCPPPEYLPDPRTHVPWVSYIACRFFVCWAIGEAHWLLLPREGPKSLLHPST